MRKFVALILIALLVLVAAAVSAQDIVETDEPTVATTTTEREIYSVLRYGDVAFEPELWFATATESTARTTATWSPRPGSEFGGALAYADYLHFDGGYPLDSVPGLFNDEWFAGTLSSYQSYNMTISCDANDLWLFEFTLQFDDAPYVMRYWVQPMAETRIMAFFILFPSADVRARQAMEDYSNRLYPDLPACPR